MKSANNLYVDMYEQLTDLESFVQVLDDDITFERVTEMHGITEKLRKVFDTLEKKIKEFDGRGDEIFCEVLED